MNKNTPTYFQSFIIAATWWLFWLIVQFLVYNRISGNWWYAAVESVVCTSILGLAGIVISNTYRFYSPVFKQYYLVIAYAIILHIFSVRLSYWILSVFYVKDPQYWAKFQEVMPLRALFILVMIALLSIYYWYRKSQRDELEMEMRKEEAQQLTKEAELSKLRLQLQPHFLFNSLNSISALTVTQPLQARKMIHQLSDFLRGTLHKDDQELTLLSSELDHLALYLEIEKVRFGHRLQTRLNCTLEACSMKIPVLLLQPIVENAVKFGLYDTTGEVEIVIEARSNAGNLEVSITNPFDENTAKPKAGTGFGLSAVQRRLNLLYARNDLLTTHQSAAHFVTKVIIPQNNSSYESTNH